MFLWMAQSEVAYSHCVFFHPTQTRIYRVWRLCVILLSASLKLGNANCHVIRQIAGQRGEEMHDLFSLFLSSFLSSGQCAKWLVCLHNQEPEIFRFSTSRDTVSRDSSEPLASSQRRYRWLAAFDKNIIIHSNHSALCRLYLSHLQLLIIMVCHPLCTTRERWPKLTWP